LSRARLVTISGDSAEGGAAQSATSNITSVIQTVLAAQLVSGSGMLTQGDNNRERGESARDNGRSGNAAGGAPLTGGSTPAKPGSR
jgi:hypothetical protein